MDFPLNEFLVLQTKTCGNFSVPPKKFQQTSVSSEQLCRRATTLESFLSTPTPLSLVVDDDDDGGVNVAVDERGNKIVTVF